MTRSNCSRFAGLVLAGSLLYGLKGDAHKPITSPYTYNDDVFPILRDRCGRCHVPGGVAPMSLMTYKDAYPWGESIRTELIAGHMPPWPVEGEAIIVEGKWQPTVPATSSGAPRAG